MTGCVAREEIMGEVEETLLDSRGYPRPSEGGQHRPGGRRGPEWI